MLAWVGLLALALAVAVALHARRREEALRRELATAAERVAELAARVEAVEQDAAQAMGQAAVTEELLLEKGIADEEDLEDLRRRLDAGGAPATPRGRDEALH